MIIIESFEEKGKKFGFFFPTQFKEVPGDV